MAVDPVKRCRRAPVQLIRDLTLEENLWLEPLLQRWRPASSVVSDFETLFRRAGQPVFRRDWHSRLARHASDLETLQVRVGCALMADPDILEIELGAWNAALMPPQALSSAFQAQFPWRELHWLSADTGSRIEP